MVIIMDATDLKPFANILLFLSVSFTLIAVLTPVISSFGRYIKSKRLEPTYYSQKIFFLYLLFAVICISIYIILENPTGYILDAILSCIGFMVLLIIFVVTSLQRLEATYGKGTIKRIITSRWKGEK